MKTKTLLIVISVLMSATSVSAQDVIFKRNGDIVQTKMLNQFGSNISYKLYDNRDSLTHYISISIIDSILYQNGTKDIFQSIPIKSVSCLKPKTLHHLIGVDLPDILFNRAFGISYEFLPGNTHVGFKVTHEEWAGYSHEFADPNKDFTNWNLRIGVNYYIFPQRTFRLSAGINYLFSHEKIYDYSPSYVLSIKDLHNLDISIYGFYNLSKHWAINIGYNFPISLGLSRNSNFNAIKCEIMYNF